MSSDIFVARVSDIEAWRYYHAWEPKGYEDEVEPSVESVLAQLRGETPPNERMLAGTLGHKALEDAAEGAELDYIADEKNKIAVMFDIDKEIELLPIKEKRFYQKYKLLGGYDINEAMVSGKIDGQKGNRIVDYKFTGKIEVEEKYTDSFQWKFYLDMVKDASIFEYSMFACKPASARAVGSLGLNSEFQNFIVSDHDTCRFNKYNGMHEELEIIVNQFVKWSKEVGWEGRSLEELERA